MQVLLAFCPAAVEDVLHAACIPWAHQQPVMHAQGKVLYDAPGVATRLVQLKMHFPAMNLSRVSSGALTCAAAGSKPHSIGALPTGGSKTATSAVAQY